MSKLNLRDKAEIVIELCQGDEMITRSEEKKMKSIDTHQWNMWLIYAPAHRIIDMAKKPLKEIRKFASHL